MSGDDTKKSGFSFSANPLDAKLAASLLQDGKFSLSAPAHAPVSFGFGVADKKAEPTVLIPTDRDPVGDKAPKAVEKPAEPTVMLSDGPPPKPQPKPYSR